MTELTQEELLIAAERAAVYPPGFGKKWGYGPLVSVAPDDALAEHPEWVSYG